MKQFKLNFFFGIFLFFCMACQPTNTCSHEEIQWQSITNPPTLQQIREINIFATNYPFSPHFHQACHLLDSLQKQIDLHPGYENVTGCLILSEDSIQIDDNTFHFNEVDSAVYQILSENWVPTKFKTSNGSYVYSNSVFFIAIIEDRHQLPLWVNQITKGRNRYKEEVYEFVQSLPHVTKTELNQLNQKLSSNVFLISRGNRIQVPPPPPS